MKPDSPSDDDKIKRWLENQPRPTFHFSIRSLLILTTVVAGMFSVWYVLEALSYEARQTALGCLAFAAFLFIPDFALIPRRFLPLVFATYFYGMFLGAAHGGDMGRSGYMFVSVLLLLASLAGAIAAWPLVGRRGTRRARSRTKTQDSATRK